MKSKVSFGIYQLMYVVKGFVLLIISIVIGSIVIGFWNCSYVWGFPNCDLFNSFIVGLESALKALGFLISFITGFLGIAFICYPFIYTDSCMKEWKKHIGGMK